MQTLLNGVVTTTSVVDTLNSSFSALGDDLKSIVTTNIPVVIGVLTVTLVAKFGIRFVKSMVSRAA